MSVFYMLCGIPGSGKSTWIRHNQLDEYVGLTDTSGKTYNNVSNILSTDAIIEEIASMYSLTYNDCFKDLIQFADKQMHRELDLLIKNKAPVIVWDQTNLTVNSRRKKLAKIPSNYTKIAVNFSIPDTIELNRRLNSRSGKSIPQNVIESMIANYQPASTDEGFNSITTVDN